MRSCTRSRAAVPAVFCVFVLMRALDRVFLKRVNDYLANPAYNLILTNVYWPVCIQALTVVMIAGYVKVQEDERYSWRFFLPWSPLASAEGRVPLYRMALFSFWDQMNAALQAPAAPFLALPMQSILSNFVIVWTAMIAFQYLGTRFHQVHVIGCCLVLLSAVVSVADSLEDNDCSALGIATRPTNCISAYKTSTGEYKVLSIGSMLLWYGLFIFSTLPSGVSNCYKQKVLQRSGVDVMWATFWSGNFQVFWGLAFFWINWIPLPDQAVTTPDMTFGLLRDSWACFIGQAEKPEDAACNAAGGPAILWFGVYLVFNLSFNVLLLWLTKRMSAVWAQIATVLCLDLTNIFSQSATLMGAGAQRMTLCQWLGTLLATVGLWAYNVEPEVQPGEAPVVHPSMVSDARAASFLESLLEPPAEDRLGGSHAGSFLSRKKSQSRVGSFV